MYCYIHLIQYVFLNSTLAVSSRSLLLTLLIIIDIKLISPILNDQLFNYVLVLIFSAIFIIFKN